MISKKLSNKVLTISCAYNNPKGGIAMVVYNYSKIFENFRSITTTTDGNYMKKGLKFISALFIFIYHTLKNDYTILHIHGASNISFIKKRIFISIARIFNKKIIFHCHGGEFAIFAKSNSKMVKNTLDKVDLIAALSNKWEHFFRTELGCKNVIVVENIVAEPKLEKVNKYSCKEFLFLGNIGEGKGVFDLLDIIVENKEKYKGKLILSIGGNGETERLKNYIKENKIEDIVIFEGWVSGTKKNRLLSRTDVLILPSYNEGLPITILEAMTYKMPVISTVVGGIPEIVDDYNGILINPGDKIALGNALDKMLNLTDEQYEEMGDVSYKRVEPYLPSNVEKKLSSLYISLLNK